MALFANIESRQWRRAYNAKHNMLPEHPRASTTDDVECFFSVLRDSVGKDFTLQQVKIVHFFVYEITEDSRFCMAGGKQHMNL